MSKISLLSDAHYFDESTAKASELRQLLASSIVVDKLEAMKRLTAVCMSFCVIVVSQLFRFINCNGAFHVLILPMFRYCLC